MTSTVWWLQTIPSLKLNMAPTRKPETKKGKSSLNPQFSGAKLLLVSERVRLKNFFYDHLRIDENDSGMIFQSSINRKWHRIWGTDVLIPKKPSWIIQTHCWFQLGKRKRSKKLQFDTPDGTVLKCFTYLNPGGPRVAGGDRRPKTRAQLLILLIEDFPKIHQYWSSQKYIYPPGNSHKPNEREVWKIIDSNMPNIRGIC